MNGYRRFQSYVTDKLPLLVLLFCAAQPVLDVLGYWQNEWGISNTFTLLARMLLLGGSVFLGFLLTDRKWVYFVAAGVLGAFTAGHIWACMEVGYLLPVDDLMNEIRVILMPLTAICFITFLRKNEKTFDAMKKGMVLSLGIIVAVQILSTITGTDPHTYQNKGIGVLGWFMWTNCQSAILAMLAPIAIVWAIKRWPGKPIPAFLVSVISLGALYFLAPRLAFASLFAVGMGVGISVLLVNRKNWKQAVVVLLCTVLFVASYPISPTSRNQDAIDINAETRQDSVNAVLKGTDISPVKKPEKQLTEAEKAMEAWENMERLGTVYHRYLGGMVRRFGLERVTALYGSSTETEVIANARMRKINFCKLLLEDSPESARWFGMEVGRMKQRMDVYDWDREVWTVEDDVFNPENDFHAIRYMYGIVGLALMVAFLLYFGLRAFYAMCRDFKTYYTLDFAAFCISYCCAMVHAYCTCSALQRNNASVYLGMLLAGMWYLSRRELSPKRQKIRKIAGK